MEMFSDHDFDVDYVVSSNQLGPARRLSGNTQGLGTRRVCLVGIWHYSGGPTAVGVRSVNA